MHGIGGQRIGWWSLRLDAVYCAVLGILVALFSGHISEWVAAPPFVIAVGGAVTVAWAGGIVWMCARLPLRLALRLVMAVNLLAATAVGFVSAAAATNLIAIALVSIAVDVALFAGSQMIALRRLSSSS